MTRALASVALAAVLLGCTSGTPGEDPTAADPAPGRTIPTPAPTPAPSPAPTGAGLPALAPAPAGDGSLWLDTIGVPVVAAIRTSTPLARLAAVDPSEREATCRQVAMDLDRIAPPQVLAGMAITADAETATLLVGDLQAKGDLLAVCVGGGDDLAARIAEVERTHAVAVAWVARLGGDQ